MILLLAALFVTLVTTFGVFLAFANPANIERPFMVAVMTTFTGLLAGWLLWLEWHQGVPGKTGTAVAFSLLAISGFVLGRAVDRAMGPRIRPADERQSTLGADLAD